MPEQKVVVEKIEETYSIAFEIEDTAKQNIERSLRLRQSILKDAFTGKLVPQDSTDEPATRLLERIKAERLNLKAESSAGSDNMKFRNEQAELSRYVK